MFKKKQKEMDESDLAGEGIEIPIKYLGSEPVLESLIAEVDRIRDIMRRIHFSAHDKGNKINRPLKATIHVTIDFVKLTILEPEVISVKHVLPRIRLVTEDVIEKKLFAYVLKDENSTRHVCHAFECDKVDKATKTIGRAFELAYKRYQEYQGKLQDRPLPAPGKGSDGKEKSKSVFGSHIPLTIENPYMIEPEASSGDSTRSSGEANYSNLLLPGQLLALREEQAFQMNRPHSNDAYDAVAAFTALQKQNPSSAAASSEYANAALVHHMYEGGSDPRNSSAEASSEATTSTSTSTSTSSTPAADGSNYDLLRPKSDQGTAGEYDTLQKPE